MKTFINYSYGFTLIEILVVICMTAILFSMCFFVSLGSYKRYALESEKEKLVSILLKARSDAMNNIGGKPHGLHISSDSYVLFSGDYDLDDQSQEKIERDSGVELSGIDEIIFENLSGSPSILGVIALSIGGQTKNITIENEGKIDW